MKMLLVVAVLLLCFSFQADAINWPNIGNVKSPFKVENVNSLDSCSFLSSNTVNSLNSVKYVKLVCPLGMLVAGTSSYPDSYMLYAANLVAKLLDRDEDGSVDNTKMYNGLKKAFLTGGKNDQEEENGSQVKGFTDYFSLQTWKGTDEGAGSIKKILTEEVFHMVHMYGFASAWPAQFGWKDFTSSVVCREMKRIVCAKPGWHHPENKCPGGVKQHGEWGFPNNHVYRTPGSAISLPLQPGTCNDAGCDCVEFYHQAALVAAGVTPGWFSPLMPQTKSKMRQMLSSEILAVIDDPTYLQVTSASDIDGTYSASGGGGGGVTPEPDEPDENENGSECDGLNKRKCKKRKAICAWQKQSKTCEIKETETEPPSGSGGNGSSDCDNYNSARSCFDNDCYWWGRKKGCTEVPECEELTKKKHCNKIEYCHWFNGQKKCVFNEEFEDEN